MNDDRRRELIERYKEGPRVLAASLEGITPQEMDFRPAPGEWSPREVVHHCADSEMTAAIRLRLMLAQDGPRIVGYDQEEFARRLHYNRPVEPSLDAVVAARRTTADLLDRMAPADWARTAQHGELDHYGVETWLEIYGAHLHDHADQIRRAREAALELAAR